MMHTLAKVGFHQSYSYFTWRPTAAEMGEYLTELTGPSSFYMRPNFWPTTHDILTPDMQRGGAPYWKMRAALAAAGSPSYGIYTGYEFIESVPRPGVEEQIDNEKYEYKHRDWAHADDYGMATLLTTLNRVRREHIALRGCAGSPSTRRRTRMCCASRRHVSAEESPKGKADTVIVVASFDPHVTHDAIVTLDMAAIGRQGRRPRGRERRDHRRKLHLGTRVLRAARPRQYAGAYSADTSMTTITTESEAVRGS